MKYSVNQKVQVIDNTSAHGFRYGEIVTIKEVKEDRNVYMSSNGMIEWFLSEDEISSEIRPVSNYLKFILDFFHKVETHMFLDYEINNQELSETVKEIYIKSKANLNGKTRKAFGINSGDTVRQSLFIINQQKSA